MTQFIHEGSTPQSRKQVRLEELLSKELKETLTEKEKMELFEIRQQIAQDNLSEKL